MVTTVVGAGPEYYDFMHYLASVGTKKFIYASISSGSSTTVYTVPSGKKAYIVALASAPDIEHKKLLIVRIKNSGGTTKFMFKDQTSGTASDNYNSTTPLELKFIEMDEGDYIQAQQGSTGYGVSVSFLIYEVSK